MRRLLFSVVTFAAVLSSTGLLRADEPRAVIEKAIQAAGGRENLAPIKATRATLKGIIHESDILERAVVTAEVVSQLPRQFKLIGHITGNGVVVVTTQILNGDKAWIQANDMNDPANARELEDMKQSAYVDYVATLLPLLEDKAYTLTALPDAAVQGRPAVGVKVVSKGHPDISLYFDKQTGLLAKIEHRRPDPDAQNAALLLREEFLSDYRVVDPVAPEEALLKRQGVATEGPGLLDALRKGTLTAAEREQIKSLIRGLGSNQFAVREKSKKGLVAQGRRAVALLRDAAKDPDPEVASRARECLEAIPQEKDSATARAVLRLVAYRKPEGAAGVLLDYLSSAADEAVARETRMALAAVARHDGKPDPELTRALDDKDPTRRAAAAAALGSDPKAPAAEQRLFPHGVRRAFKGLHLRDGKKYMEWDLLEVQFFNRVEEREFEQPKP